MFSSTLFASGLPFVALYLELLTALLNNVYTDTYVHSPVSVQKKQL
jgi:hypothetical protein